MFRGCYWILCHARHSYGDVVVGVNWLSPVSAYMSWHDLRLLVVDMIKRVVVTVAFMGLLLLDHCRNAGSLHAGALCKPCKGAKHSAMLHGCPFSSSASIGSSVELPHISDGYKFNGAAPVK